MYPFAYINYNSSVHHFLAIKIHFTDKTAERREKRNWNNSPPTYILPTRALENLKKRKRMEKILTTQQKP